MKYADESDLKQRMTKREFFAYWFLPFLCMLPVLLSRFIIGGMLFLAVWNIILKFAKHRMLELLKTLLYFIPFVLLGAYQEYVTYKFWDSIHYDFPVTLYMIASGLMFIGFRMLLKQYDVLNYNPDY